MLLVHQAGSVKVGEVIRYTLTYTPSADRILPTPAHLHLKIKNTSAIPLRAAYLHGPYTLHVSAYPSTFNPNQKVEDPRRYGVPEFEPLLKAGGHWSCRLVVPEDIRESGARPSSERARRSHEQPTSLAKQGASATWIIEIASQILFSNSAAVHFELLVGRDERSLELGFAAVAGHGHGAPGLVQDHQKTGRRDSGAPKGVYSRAVKLVVEDTDALWNKPALVDDIQEQNASHNQTTRPSAEQEEKDSEGVDGRRSSGKGARKSRSERKKKVHIVFLTHGLHSNLGADMLYLKESIDATARQAREDARKRKRSDRSREGTSTSNQGTPESPVAKDTSTAPLSGGQDGLGESSNDEDEEEVIVRGFTGNAVRTEKGIQYLGKRLAKYVLRFTYPDQPFLPVKKSLSQSFSDRFTSTEKKDGREGHAAHHGSSIHLDEHEDRAEDLSYTFTSISFIGHSLGGLVQLYAVAYIQKHAPHFFSQIKPVNFICMASPLLGLSNENPMYVKFALDFGLVGRTGQDLGLTWRAPTIAKSGWSAMVGGFSGGQKDEKHEDPGAKPLLRILPTGPAHTVLHLFRNRTLYSNVVNDGIVPLRTSCLLFLDWRGLGRVEKARRENGLVGTMAEWTWAELTGANSLNPSHRRMLDESDSESVGSEGNIPVRQGDDDSVPQPSENTTQEDNENSGTVDPHSTQFVDPEHERKQGRDSGRRRSSTGQTTSMLDELVNFFRPAQPSKPSKPPKVAKAIRRGQTLRNEDMEDVEGVEGVEDENTLAKSTSRGNTDNPTMRPTRAKATRGDSLEGPSSDLRAPPKTSIFESASDILHPPIPSNSWICDPSSRPRTIFHDRVYHPEDIPPPPVRRPTRLSRTFSSDSARSSKSSGIHGSRTSTDEGAMKVEEKIARAYHRDLSWRKVLVRLEPDAHNNMIVRRMFANAYGWPVVKHLCDTHFADTWAATTRDEDEPAIDRAQGVADKPSVSGEEVAGQSEKARPRRKSSEMREVRDELADLQDTKHGISSIDDRHKMDRQSSAVWDDSFFEGSDDEDEESETGGYRAAVQRLLNPGKPAQSQGNATSSRAANSRGSSEGHRGLQPTLSVDKTRPSRVEKSDNGGDPSSALVTSELTEEPQSLDASVTPGP